MKVVGISEISRKASDLRKLHQSIQKEADGFLNSHDVFSMKDVKTYDDPRLKQINAILKDKSISKEVKAIYKEEKVWLLKKQVKILTHCLDSFMPESKDVLIFYLYDSMEIYDPQNFVRPMDPHHPVKGLKELAFDKAEQVHHLPLNICGSHYTVWYCDNSFNAIDEDIGTVCVEDEDGNFLFLDELFAITGVYDEKSDTIAPMNLDDLKQVYIFVSRNGEMVEPENVSKYSWKKLIEDNDNDMTDMEW